MSPRPSRAEQQTNLPEAIKATAWRQIAQTGAPALSLRAIARELNITAPAIYNYFPDRDALVTALIVDAFTSHGDAQAASVVSIPEEAYALRLRSLGLAYREWAIAYPERYQLIFGTPIAGYVAPLEITMLPAARSLALLVGVLSAAQAAGQLRPAVGTPSRQLQAMFDAWQQERGPAEANVLFLALLIWGQVHGLVSLEISHQFPAFITDVGEVYRQTVDLLIAQYLLDAE